MSIIGNVWLQSESFLPSGNRMGDTVVDGNLRLGNVTFTMNGLRGRGTITLNNGYTPSLVVGDNDSDGDFEGNINRTNGTLSFRKIGKGTQRIGGSVAINGPLSVENGTLLLDGEVTGTSPSVAAGAALGGSGGITNDVTFADGAKLAVTVANDVASCLTVAGIVSGGPVTVDVSIKSGRWKTAQCILTSGTSMGEMTFVKGAAVGSLELRNNGTELWATPKRNGFAVVIR